jgi:hypothetical protein
LLDAALNFLSHEYKPCGVCWECVAFFSGKNRDVKECGGCKCWSVVLGFRLVTIYTIFL